MINHGKKEIGKLTIFVESEQRGVNTYFHAQITPPSDRKLDLYFENNKYIAPMILVNGVRKTSATDIITGNNWAKNFIDQYCSVVGISSFLHNLSLDSAGNIIVTPPSITSNIPVKTTKPKFVRPKWLKHETKALVRVRGIKVRDHLRHTYVLASEKARHERYDQHCKVCLFAATCKTECGMPEFASQVDLKKLPKTFNVAGVTFDNQDGTSRQKLISNLNKSSIYFLVPETGNKYDEFAVQVVADCQTIGYVPKELSQLVTLLLKQKRLQQSPSAVVHGGWDEGVSFGVKVELKLLSSKKK